MPKEVRDVEWSKMVKEREWMPIPERAVKVLTQGRIRDVLSTAGLLRKFYAKVKESMHELGEELMGSDIDMLARGSGKSKERTFELLQLISEAIKQRDPNWRFSAKLDGIIDNAKFRQDFWNEVQTWMKAGKIESLFLTEEMPEEGELEQIILHLHSKAPTPGEEKKAEIHRARSEYQQKVVELFDRLEKDNLTIGQLSKAERILWNRAKKLLHYLSVWNAKKATLEHKIELVWKFLGFGVKASLQVQALNAVAEPVVETKEWQQLLSLTEQYMEHLDEGFTMMDELARVVYKNRELVQTTEAALTNWQTGVKTLVAEGQQLLEAETQGG